MLPYVGRVSWEMLKLIFLSKLKNPELAYSVRIYPLTSSTPHSAMRVGLRTYKINNISKVNEIKKSHPSIILSKLAKTLFFDNG